jgi:hypothetical protein
MFLGFIFKLFVLLALGYTVCVLANRQQGMLKAVGTGLGIGIMLISLAYGLYASSAGPGMCHKGFGKYGKMAKMHGKPWKMHGMSCKVTTPQEQR